MNLPNKITLTRIFVSVFILLMMVFPFYEVNCEFPTYLIAGRVTLSLKYIICGILFILASVTDFLDGNIARKRHLVTDN
jgi:CDP-diacylglycerol--glycerol-3-phosphate 3-phosphatidyltransferase